MDEDDPMGQFEAGEEKSIVMRVPKPLPPPSGEYLGRPVFPLFAWLPRTLYSHPRLLKKRGMKLWSISITS